MNKKTVLDRIKKIIDDNGLSSRVISHVRYIPDSEVSEVFSASDICVLVQPPQRPTVGAAAWRELLGDGLARGGQPHGGRVAVVLPQGGPLASGPGGSWGAGGVRDQIKMSLGCFAPDAQIFRCYAQNPCRDAVNSCVS